MGAQALPEGQSRVGAVASEPTSSSEVGDSGEGDQIGDGGDDDAARFAKTFRRMRSIVSVWNGHLCCRHILANSYNRLAFPNKSRSGYAAPITELITSGDPGLRVRCPRERAQKIQFWFDAWAPEAALHIDRRANAFSSDTNSSMTSVQSPVLFWRNNLIVGYQIVSRPLNGHRQSQS
jgi:hypothetical protein